MLGDSFSCACIAFVLQHALMLDGLVPKLQTVAEMRPPQAEGHAPVLSREEMQYRQAKAHIVVSLAPCFNKRFTF